MRQTRSNRNRGSRTKRSPGSRGASTGRGGQHVDAHRIAPVGTSVWSVFAVWMAIPILLIVAISFPVLTAATLAGIVLGVFGSRIDRRLQSGGKKRRFRRNRHSTRTVSKPNSLNRGR